MSMHGFPVRVDSERLERQKDNCMSRGATLALRIPITLLALADLAILGVRLMPWSEIVNLPGQGNTGYDPLICLTVYTFLLFWLSGNRHPDFQKMLSVTALLGLLGGLMLAGQVTLFDRMGLHTPYVYIGLLVAAGVTWGIAGLRGVQISGNPTIGIVAGLWSAMISALLGSGAALLEIDLRNPRPLTSDPWKQYEGLAIGSQAMQTLVHGLNTATGFLLICPLVGGAVGLMFALGRPEGK